MIDTYTEVWQNLYRYNVSFSQLIGPCFLLSSNKAAVLETISKNFEDC